MAFRAFAFWFREKCHNFSITTLLFKLTVKFKLFSTFHYVLKHGVTMLNCHMYVKCFQSIYFSHSATLKKAQCGTIYTKLQISQVLVSLDHRSHLSNDD